MNFIKNNKSTDFTNTTIETFNYLKLIHKNNLYSVRINNMFQLMKEAYGLDEFDILDSRNCNNGDLDSFLIDRQIDWINGKNVNFGEISNKILEIGDFTEKEKDMFNEGKFEERLWAIYLLVCSPNLDSLTNLKSINKNDRS